MQFAIKLIIAIAIIVTCSLIAKSRPELAGLIAVMPLTGLLVMLWVYTDNQGDTVEMGRYTLGAVWGIIPALFFFVAAYVCFRCHLHLAWVLAISASVWLAGAVVHQYFLAPTAVGN